MNNFPLFCSLGREPIISVQIPNSLFSPTFLPKAANFQLHLIDISTTPCNWPSVKFIQPTQGYAAVAQHRSTSRRSSKPADKLL